MAIKDIIGQPINVKNLETDVPRTESYYPFENILTPREIPFDPQRDISEQEKADILSDLITFYRRVSRTPKGWFIDYLGAVNTLFPNVIEQLPQAEQLWHESQNSQQHIGSGNTVWAHAEVYDALAKDKLIFPRKWESLVDHVNDRYLKIKDELSEIPYGKMTAYQYQCLLKGVFALKVLSPGLIPDDFLENPSFHVEPLRLNSMLTEEYRFTINLSLQNLSYMKILSPEKLKSSNILNNDFWRKALEELNKWRAAKNYYAFSWFAEYLTILSADEAKITEDGKLQITMRKPNEQVVKSEPMPEERSF